MTLALAAAAIAFALWCHRPRIDTRLRLYDMMRLRGVPQPRLEDDDVAAAQARCAACASKKLCDALLSTGNAKGYRQFCPNALYLEWLHSNSLNFD
ncbi:MAG: DUF6455 family protein [Burkholderiales bacterium]